MAFRICAILCFLFISTNAAPSGLSAEFKRCQVTYDSVIVHLDANSGEGATASVWRYLFYDIDLDGNEQVTASEIALYLEKEHYVHETDIMEVMRQASQWVAVSDGGDEQLNRDEFVKAVKHTVGEKNDPADNAKYEEVSACMCKIFTLKVPHLTETMSGLSTCTDHLERAIEEDVSERAEFNSWSAIFRTMDANNDKKIDFEELKKTIADHSTKDDVALASALGHAIYGELHHDVYDITEKHFYVFVHELLYGLKTTARQQPWEDVVSEQELHGRTVICNSIKEVREKLTRNRDLMGDCIRAYERTRQSVLGADGVFAPEIVFTMADANKDGEISQEEFDSFIGSASDLYAVVQQRSHAEKGMKIGEFRALMPDEIVVAKKRGDFSAVLESSALTAPELGDAEKLCSAIIDAVQKYPGDSQSAEHHAYHFPSSGMSFLSQGEHIMVAHPFPEEGEEGDALTETTTPEIPEATSQDNTVVYHIMGADGVPFELSLSHAEVDDISHRILMAQDPPQEPESGESRQGGVPSEPTGEPPAESGGHSEELSEEEEERRLIEEIQKLIHVQNSEQEEPTQHPDVTEPVVPSQAPSVASETNVDDELEHLIQAIQAAKSTEGGKTKSERS